jgi:hypothetical protein
MALLFITVVSLVVAVVMSVVAWRLARDERHRSAARVATLAAEIHDPHEASLDRDIQWASGERTNEQLFAGADVRTPGNPFRALAIGVLVVGSVIALVVFASGSGGTPVTSGGIAGAAPAARVASTETAPPIELISLGHERSGDRLIVRGVVRYSTRPELAGLIAFVSVLNHQGEIVASGQAVVTGTRPVVVTSGAAGVESSFSVTVPGVTEVSRYRVGFKSNDRIIAHVDRRDHGVTAELP